MSRAWHLGMLSSSDSRRPGVVDSYHVGPWQHLRLFCVTVEMLIATQLWGPRPSSMGSEGGEITTKPLQMGHTSLHSKHLCNYQPGQRTESPWSSASGSSRHLGFLAVLSGRWRWEGGWFSRKQLELGSSANQANAMIQISFDSEQQKSDIFFTSQCQSESVGDHSPPRP